MPGLVCPAWHAWLGMPGLVCPAWYARLGMPGLVCPAWNAQLGMPGLVCPACYARLGMPGLECPAWNARLGMPGVVCPAWYARRGMPGLVCPSDAAIVSFLSAIFPVKSPRVKNIGLLSRIAPNRPKGVIRNRRAIDLRRSMTDPHLRINLQNAIAAKRASPIPGTNAGSVDDMTSLLTETLLSKRPTYRPLFGAKKCRGAGVRPRRRKRD